MKSISEFLYVAGAVLIAGPGECLLVEDEPRHRSGDVHQRVNDDSRDERPRPRYDARLRSDQRCLDGALDPR
jgi:hypothetical protein